MKLEVLDGFISGVAVGEDRNVTAAMPPADVLIFAEDPGAANFVADLPSGLEKYGYRALFITMGHATSRAATLDVSHVTVSPDPEPDRLLEQVKPRLLITGTSDRVDTPGLALICAARKRGIRTLGIADGQAAYAHRFRGSGDTSTSFAPDWLAVPDEITADNYASAGFMRDRIQVVGNPYFDRVRAAAAKIAEQDRENTRNRLFPDAGKRHIVVFATEISRARGHADHSPRVNDTLHGFSGTTLRTHLILEETLGALGQFAEKPYLVLRLHPKTPRTEFEAYVPHFDRISAAEDEDQSAMLYAADLIVGLTTILLEEAMLFGTPSLSILRRADERYWLTGTRDGWVPCALSRSEIFPAIVRGLSQSRNGTQASADAALPAGARERLLSWVTKLLEPRF